jgi:hypothetical protein
MNKILPANFLTLSTAVIHSTTIIWIFFSGSISDVVTVSIAASLECMVPREIQVQGKDDVHRSKWVG